MGILELVFDNIERVLYVICGFWLIIFDVVVLVSSGGFIRILC